MKISKEILNNGATLVLAPVEGVKSTSIFYFIKSGSRKENEKNNGIAHFIEHMMFKGTTKRPTALDISQEIDSIGAYFNAFTDRENTAYYVKTAGEHLGKALDVLSDMVLSSTFDGSEIEKEKGVIVEEIRMYKDPSWHIGDIYESLIYQNSTLGLPIAGEENTVTSFNRQTFLDFYGANYGAENIILILVGNLENEKGKAKEFLNKFRAGTGTRENNPVPLQEKPRLILERRDVQQGQFHLGVPGYSFTHPDKFSLRLMSIILGGNMSSRLFSEVREKRGLAYSIHTTTEGLSDTGHVTTLAGVERSKIYDALKLILEEYQRIGDDATEEELQRAKDYYKGSFVISLEDTSRIATFLASQIFYQGDALSIEEILEKIEEVKLGDVKRVSKDIFKKEKLNLAVIGPYENREKFDKILEI